MLTTKVNQFLGRLGRRHDRRHQLNDRLHLLAEVDVGHTEHRRIGDLRIESGDLAIGETESRKTTVNIKW